MWNGVDYLSSIWNIGYHHPALPLFGIEVLEGRRLLGENQRLLNGVGLPTPKGAYRKLPIPGLVAIWAGMFHISALQARA